MVDEDRVGHVKSGDSGLSEDEYARLESEFEGLRLLRDEMRVQLDLAVMEARDRYRAAEQRWESLEARMQDLSGGADASAASAELVRVTRNLFEEIREAYQEISRLVPPRKG